jgi:hypothetical protein
VNSSTQRLEANLHPLLGAHEPVVIFTHTERHGRCCSSPRGHEDRAYRNLISEELRAAFRSLRASTGPTASSDR